MSVSLLSAGEGPTILVSSSFREHLDQWMFFFSGSELCTFILVGEQRVEVSVPFFFSYFYSCRDCSNKLGLGLTFYQLARVFLGPELIIRPYVLQSMNHSPVNGF